MKVANYISRHGKAILVIALVLVVPSVIGTMKTGVDYNVLNYLPRSLDSMRGEAILDKEFGSAATGMLIVEKKTSRETMDLKAKIAAIPGVKSIVGVDDVIDPNIPREVLPSELRERVYSSEGTILLIQYEAAADAAITDRATRAIRAVLDKDCYLSSASAGNIDYQAASSKEVPIFLTFAVLSLALILALGMESWFIPVIFLVEIGLAIIYNLGSNVIFGKISFLSQSLAAVLQLGVTMDFSIFLLHRYDSERKRFADKRDAMAEAIRKTFLTISSGASTEIAGFLALCVMELSIGADIGIVMAKGVLIGLIGTMTVLPALILVFDKPIQRLSHRPFIPSFKGMGRFVTRFAVPLCLLFAALFVPAYYGRSHMEEDYSLDAGMPKTYASVAAGEKLKNDFGLTTTHFVIVRDDLPPAAIRDMLTEIENVQGVGAILAIEKYLGALIPEEFLPDSIRGIFKHGGKEMIIITSAYSNSTPEASAQLDGIITAVKKFDPAGLVTGEGALAKDLVDVAARDFRRVDVVSILAILAIILLLFGSVSLPLILVGCIELAIFINLGIPFFIGKKVSFLSTIVIGCIQLGVTIDYAILLVTRFREELRKGLPRKEAMRLAFEASAPSIVTSALALFLATESVALISNMTILKSICSLIARGALISMVVILVFLPALLVAFEKVISVTTLNWRKPLAKAAKPPCAEQEMSES